MSTGANNAQLYGPCRYDVQLAIGHVRGLAAPASLKMAESKLNVRAHSGRRLGGLFTALAYFVRGLRQVISIVLLSVPLIYLFYVLIGAGVLRPQLIDNLRLGAVITELVTPVQLLGTKAFAMPTTYRGVDMLLLGCVILAFVLRSMALRTLDRLHAWAGGAKVAETCRPGPRHQFGAKPSTDLAS